MPNTKTAESFPMARSDEILAFWSGDGIASEDRARIWFSGGPEFDRSWRRIFLADYERAAAGLLDDWQENPVSCLALVLLLDQLPRNIFRDTPRAYATDAKARAVTKQAISGAFDRHLPPVHRAFLYLPLEHSEDLADQRESLRLQRRLVEENPECEGFLKYAEEHRATIKRFGRFPQRNAILGRASTPQEIAFLRGKINS